MSPEFARAALRVASLSLLLPALWGCGGGVVRPGHLHLGNEHFDAGRPLSAAEEYRLALAEEPKDFRIHYNLALAYHRAWIERRDAGEGEIASGYRDLARAGYERTLELDPLNVRAEVGLARLASDDGRRDEALEILRGMRSRVLPDEVMPLTALAGMIREEQPAEAAEILREALALNPEHRGAAVLLVELLLAETPPALEAAREVLDQALGFNPDDFTLRRLDARLTLREAEFRDDQETWLRACRAFERALALVDGDWWLHEGLARCHERDGRWEDAVRELWTARDLASDAELRREGLEPEAWRGEISRRLLALYPRLAESERP